MCVVSCFLMLGFVSIVDVMCVVFVSVVCTGVCTSDSFVSLVFFRVFRSFLVSLFGCCGSVVMLLCVCWCCCSLRLFLFRSRSGWCIFSFRTGLWIAIFVC